MNTTHRHYSDEMGDFNRLCCFMIDHNSAVRRFSTWVLGRIVDWKYGVWGDKLSTPGFWEKNAELWFDGFGKLAGFVISEEGGSDIAIITTAGYRFLFEEMLNWAIESWADRGPALSIEITASQSMEIPILERYQFTKDASFYRSHFDLTSELSRTSPLADGFRIVDMKSNPDIRAKCILRRNAFGGKSDMNEEEIARESKIHEFGHQSPIYHPDTDLYVLSPEGIFVSGCEALIDIQNLEADIERVCTHSDYRRKGFARAVIQECLVRLKTMGIIQAHITGYSSEAIALYGSLSEGNQSEYMIYKG